MKKQLNFQYKFFAQIDLKILIYFFKKKLSFYNDKNVAIYIYKPFLTNFKEWSKSL